MNGTPTISSTTGELGGGLLRRSLRRQEHNLSASAPRTSVAAITETAEVTLDSPSEPTSELSGQASRSEREQQQQRNAEARRKLEARRELELLRRQLSEPWDEIGGT